MTLAWDLGRVQQLWPVLFGCFKKGEYFCHPDSGRFQKQVGAYIFAHIVGFRIWVVHLVISKSASG